MVPLRHRQCVVFYQEIDNEAIIIVILVLLMIPAPAAMMSPFPSWLYSSGSQFKIEQR